MLSIKEMRLQISNHCKGVNTCNDCPLVDLPGDCSENATDEEVIRNHKILYDSDKNNTPIDTDVLEKRGYTLEDFEKIEKEVYEQFGITRDGFSIDNILNMYEDYILPGKKPTVNDVRKSIGMEPISASPKIIQLEKNDDIFQALVDGRDVFRVNLEKKAVCNLSEKSINCIRRDLCKPEYIYFIVEEV